MPTLQPPRMQHTLAMDASHFPDAHTGQRDQTPRLSLKCGRHPLDTAESRTVWIARNE